jgi:hypothetical protein
MSEMDGMVEAAPQDLVVMRVRREIEDCWPTRGIGTHTDLLDRTNETEAVVEMDHLGPAGEREERGNCRRQGPAERHRAVSNDSILESARLQTSRALPFHVELRFLVLAWFFQQTAPTRLSCIET